MSDNEQILDTVRKFLDIKIRATWDSIGFWEPEGRDNPEFLLNLRLWTELETVRKMLDDLVFAKDILTIWEDYNDRCHGKND